MSRPTLLAFIALTIISLLLAPALLAQETENYGPPAILWAVPHIQLYNGDGSTNILRGLDASLAIPLSPRTNVTATWFFDGHADDYATATFNYDHTVFEDTILRGSVGMIRDDFGYGLTLHRDYEKFGVGAFAQVRDGSFEGGMMLTKQVPWGVKLGNLPLRQRGESRDWNSGAGNVGDLGARAALGWRSGHHGEIATTTAYFPQRRQSWPREGHSVQSASYTSTEFAPPAKLAWRYQTEGPVRTSAAIVDGTAYVGSYDGWLYALDVSNGHRLWRFPAESAITGAPSVCDDQIFFGTEAGEVFCVAQPRKNGPPTGQLVWRYKTSAAVTASPLVTDSGLVLIGSCDSYVYALDRDTGKLIWKLSTGGPVLASASKIGRRIPAGLDTNGKATARSATVLCGSSDGKLYAIEEVSGQIVWTFTSDGPITAAPTLLGDRLYLTNRSGSVYALQPATGRQLWALRVPGSIAHSPGADDQRLYVGTTEGGVFAIECATGKMVWQCDLRATLAASPTLVNGKLMYLASRDGRLWTMDRPTGQIVNFQRENEPLTTCAAIADGHLLVGGDNGSVYAYRPGAGGPPLPAMDIADLPKPIKPLEPERPVAPATTASALPAAGPTISAPTAPVVKPPGATMAPPTAATVAVKPTGPISTPPSASAAPSAPTVQPATTKPAPTAPLPPAQPAVAPQDFPSAVISQSAVQPAPPAAAQPVPTVKPSAPTAMPPPSSDTPVVAPPTDTPIKPPAPTAGNRTPLLTLGCTPADGRTPLLLSNQSYLFVGGKIAPGSNITGIRVNGLDAPIKDGEYSTQVSFPGPGDYLLLVEAIERSGERSTYRRTITVVSGIDAVSPNKLTLKHRGGSPIALLNAGTRGLQMARFRKTIEVRNAEGQLVHNWVMSADQNQE
ncbi:MAG: PQQ-binding-like beta-propeller repeat protein, partial [Bacteroidota bacterium]